MEVVLRMSGDDHPETGGGGGTRRSARVQSGSVAAGTGTPTPQSPATLPALGRQLCHHQRVGDQQGTPPTQPPSRGGERLGITVADVVPIKETHLVLADLRHHAGLTQQAAADAVGLKRSMYRAIETGTRAADAQQRTQHAQLYSITTNQFDTLWQHTRDTHIVRLKAR